MNGKQVRIKRSELINRLKDEEYIFRYANPVWLHQIGRWDVLDARSL